MLKIQDCFSAMSPEFDEKKDYYNNFFIIQNRIVPASKIIEQIINALKTGALMGGGTMHYELLPTEDKGAVLQKYLNEPNHQPNLNYLARRVRINYDITIAV